MKEAVTFLNFDGNCREAMEFYKKCFDAELFLLPYSEAPGDPARAAESVKDRILHSSLTKGPLTILMAADTMPGAPFERGNGFSVAIQCDSVQEIDALFSALGDDGSITMPLQETFWATSFGMLTDRFGIRWLLNLGKPVQE
ncbi:MAG: VOC family protein [Bryobacteraceae bacterium]